MALSKNSKRYNKLVANLKKARAARSRNARAKRKLPASDETLINAYETGAAVSREWLSETLLSKLIAKRDRLATAIEVLQELEG